MKSWEVKKLEDIFEFSNGLWTGKKPPFIEVGVIRNTNFTKDCEFDDSDIAYLNVEQSQFAKRKLQYGDLILEKSGGGPKQAVGRVVVFDKHDGDFSFSNFTSLMRVKNPKELDFNYLHKYLFFSYLSGATEKMQSHSTGIRNLKFNEYKQILVPVPPLPEQKQIVKILNEVFEKIAKAKENTEKNLKNAHELFESYLQSVFANPGDGWETKKLGEVCVLRSGTTLPPAIEKTSGDLPYLKVADMNLEENQTYIVTSSRFVDKSDINGNGIIPIGSTIFPKRGGAIFTNKKRITSVSICMDLNLMAVTPKKEIASEFIFYYFLGLDLRKINSGSSIPQINNYNIEPLIISFPASLPEQKRIVTKLDALSAEAKKFEAIYQQKIADLEELKKSILQKAFNGELAEAQG
jgi:type I restriction enzyme S subunit